ncbi:MAG: response regulator [Gammaproteobacteria bacterium]|nr:response regulator [Gammaproteobacteria bacterium]MCW8987942.1 response regulator [Gammaproteobacteria bacterium]MCW9031434.1 response regulator [Gammaproteobacteria bacterium]
MNNQNTTIYIIDDDPSMLRYLSELVETLNYKSRTYDNANDFLNSYNDDGLGCLVLDLRLPGISGLELQQQLAGKNIDLPVIMISGFGDVSTAVKAMKAGVLDFLEKPFKGQDLLDLINNAVNKHQTDREKNLSHNEALCRIQSLTQREKEVMDHVVAGMLNKDIAKKLEISIKTVEVHRANVMDKMAVSSVADLVRASLEANDG